MSRDGYSLQKATVGRILYPHNFPVVSLRIFYAGFLFCWCLDVLLLHHHPRSGHLVLWECTLYLAIQPVSIGILQLLEICAIFFCVLHNLWIFTKYYYYQAICYIWEELGIYTSTFILSVLN